MENVRGFYDNIFFFIEEAIKKDQLHLRLGYKSIGNFDWNETLLFKDKIINKALSLNEKDRLLYVSLLIREFEMIYHDRLVYDEIENVEVIRVHDNGKNSCRDYRPDEAERLNIIGEKKIEPLFLYKHKECTIEVGALVFDCSFFPRMVSSYFSLLNIDMEKIASETGCSSEMFHFSETPIMRYQDREYRYTDWNKPILTNPQAVILFTMLKDKKVIMRDIDKTKMANAINILTGFSSNTLRQNLSKELTDLFVRKDNIKSIQDLLTEIVIDLEKEKSKLLI